MGKVHGSLARAGKVKSKGMFYVYVQQSLQKKYKSQKSTNVTKYKSFPPSLLFSYSAFIEIPIKFFFFFIIFFFLF